MSDCANNPPGDDAGYKVGYGRPPVLRVAARVDINAFKALQSWPVHAVALNLRRSGSDAPPFTVAACASAIEASGEITLTRRCLTGVMWWRCLSRSTSGPPSRMVCSNR